MEWDYVRPWLWNQKSMRTWQGSSFTSAVNLLRVHKATARRASQQQFVWPHQGIITVACINMSRIFPIIRQFGVWRRYTSCLCKLRLRSMVLQSSERGSNSFRRWRGTTALYKNLDHRIFPKSSLLLTLEPMNCWADKGLPEYGGLILKGKQDSGTQGNNNMVDIRGNTTKSVTFVQKERHFHQVVPNQSSTYHRLDMNAVINKWFRHIFTFDQFCTKYIKWD